MVKSAIEYVHATYQYDPTKALAKHLIDAIAETRPRQVYSVDPAVGDPMPGLPPVDPDAIAMLQGKSVQGNPSEDAVPNFPAAEVLLTFIEWPLKSLQGTPKFHHPNHLEHLSEKSIVKIWLPAHRHSQQWASGKGSSLSAHQRPTWWELLTDHFLQHGNFDEIFGDRKIFDGVGRVLAPKMQSIPVAKPSAPVAVAQAADPLEGRLPA